MFEQTGDKPFLRFTYLGIKDVAMAAAGLFQIEPKLSAARPASPWRYFILGAIVGGIISGFLFYPNLIFWINYWLVSGVLLIILFFKSLFLIVDLCKESFGKKVSYNFLSLKNDELPIYTVVLPLYKEARMVPHLMQSLKNFDYPRHLLDIIFMLEEDDLETIEAVYNVIECNNTLPVHIIVCPECLPRTKPKALNAAIPYMKGEYIVIYDAEDHPEPLQLKKALCHFNDADDKVAALQARLVFHNAGQNLLTRLFSLEYDIWFSHFLPNLVRFGFPVPLGGTSTHLKYKALIEVKGWDAFNVTEDCDLGMRLMRSGYRVEILDSYTSEEATSKLGIWIKQRTRWMKGYMQTWIVHGRHPIHLIKDAGLWQFIGLHFVITGRVFPSLLYPFLILISCVAFYSPNLHYFKGWETSLAVAGLLFVWGLVYPVLTALFVALKRRRGFLWIWSLFTLFYGLLISFSTLRAFKQLGSNPSLWEKTEHGFSPLYKESRDNKKA